MSESSSAGLGGVDLAMALLGGFRGILAEVVWFKADRQQSEGEFTELAQLAAYLTHLEPHTPEVWSYASWNLAYNVSASIPTAEDRWRWVEAGIKLIRDDGLRLNPADPLLAKDLGWFYLTKIGGNLDDASPYYRAQLGKAVSSAYATGDWSGLGLDTGIMAEVERAYGPQDWADPYSLAIYWSFLGLKKANPRQTFDLKRQILLALLMQSEEDPRKSARTLAEIKRLEGEYPEEGFDQMREAFRRKMPTLGQ